MAQIRSREIRKRARKSTLQTAVIPFDRVNYLLFAVGVIIILAGYWALSQPPANSFLSLTVAPILLVIGYCVIIPVAIMYRKAEPGLSQNGRLESK